MKKKRAVRILAVLLGLALLAALAALGLNAWVKHCARGSFLTAEQAAGDGGFDCVLVLGCQVRDDGSPSLMLRDRIDRGVELYRSGAAPKILMSGDHGTKGYDEVNTMKQLAIDAGVPSGDVFMDHAGFSTYDSVFRAKAVFQAKRVLIVSQAYHLYRALYIARALGLEACGVAAEGDTYVGQSMRELREIAARDKDAIKCIFKPDPTFLGEAIPVSGDGDATND